ncbi:hypothetical protein GYMLUDRAFT_38263 [Collybiopsis luxurians FD-317 M1]|nr:hypothetical protein GYMLUDRAFT_38263 [Collybiopsis luxurians FD-317 M1]
MVVLKRQVLLYIVGLFSLLALIAHATPLATRAKGLFGTTWILKPFKEGPFEDAEKKVFASVLTGLKLDKRISTRGANNGGIFSVAEPYKSHASKDLIVKNVVHVWGNSLGEVKALKMNGQWVASGMLTDEKLGPKAQPVIVMIKQPGEVLEDNEEYKKASKEERKEIREEAIDLTCQLVAQETVDKRLYHHDNSPDNVVFVVKNQKVVSARLVDYGAENVFHVSGDVKKADVEKFCLEEIEGYAFWD